MAAPFDYSLFGLHLRSDIELPELLETAADRPVDVEILVGAVPDIAATGSGPHPIDGGLLLAVDAVARYAVVNGDRIIVEPRPGAADQNVRLFLLGSAMAMLLHWRGLLPLHANAVEINGAAFAFMGKSGAGKSTLAAWFHDRGFQIVADDVCVVGFADDGRPQVRPGVARLRLWREVLAASGRDAADYQRSFLGDHAPDKFDVPLSHRSATDAPIDLAGVYLLERSDELRVERLTGVDAAEAVFANTYRGGYVPMAGSSHDHWAASARLVRTTPIHRAGRRWGLGDLDAQCAGLLDHARAQLGG